MRITWYGHAAFLIESNGMRVILDPYRSPDCGGYEPIDEPAEVVVLSHENDRYHSHLGQIVPPFEVIRALEMPMEGAEFKGIRFEAIHVFEDSRRLPEDEVSIIHFKSEGIHIAFLGDLGHALTDAEIAPIKGADIVIIAAGGPPTIDFPEIPTLLEAIDPRIVIPMHYLTPKINLKIQPFESFQACLPGVPVDRPGTSSIEISREIFTVQMRIVWLEHAR